MSLTFVLLRQKRFSLGLLIQVSWQAQALFIHFHLVCGSTHDSTPESLPDSPVAARKTNLTTRDKLPKGHKSFLQNCPVLLSLLSAEVFPVEQDLCVLSTFCFIWHQRTTEMLSVRFCHKWQNWEWKNTVVVSDSYHCQMINSFVLPQTTARLRLHGGK